jgi:putative lipoprotein
VATFRYNTGGVVFIAVIFAACGSSRSAETPVSKETAQAKPPVVASFDCDTLALTATFHEDRVVIELPERALTLPQVVSGSGARYSNGATTFWNKGRDATYEVKGRTQTCRERREPWQEAADRGVDFRAVGQEPGWFLEIDTGKQIRLVYDYAEHEMVTPAPAPLTKDTSTVYDVMVEEAGHLVVKIHDASCRDAMSGETFPRSVTVMVGTRTLHGCGRDITSEQ